MTLFFTFLWQNSNGIIFSFGIIICAVQIISYIYTVVVNPGLPKQEYERLIFEDESKNFRQCKDCKLWINTEERTFHCYECEVCIEGIV